MSVMHETYSLPDARCAGCILKIEKGPCRMYQA